MRIRKTAGIDLGTTNSVIAMLDATDTALITGRDEHERQIFPSVVSYHAEKRQPVVGVPASRLMGQAAEPVASIKRFMGLDREFTVGPDRLKPPHVSARILRHLREVLARTLADDRYILDSAIITMPAYFNHDQIEATRQAGELAGYEVVELLHEPTAAAIYYSWLLNHTAATYLVYDLGGGTFDVSVIRKHYGDYEVLSVSGDPFLGGDDFDRLLATHLVQSGQVAGDRRLEVAPGSLNFARLVYAAEGIKKDLSVHERVRRDIPDLLRDEDGAPVSLDVVVDRATFTRLIKDKVDRTIECCHEALRRARDKAGIRLAEIDYVVLVGGSSKIPLVRETVRMAFCNPNLPERARAAEPLLHEPDLCVAYGAALRAATYGTRYLFDRHPPVAPNNSPYREEEAGPAAHGLEVHVTSSRNVQATAYQLAGVVRPWPAEEPRRAAGAWDGASVRIECVATGVVEEAFLDDNGTFEQAVELRPDQENPIRLTVCDPAGHDQVRVDFGVRHHSAARDLGQGVLPTQLITKPLQIEVLNRRSHTRTKLVVAPVGSCLPGTFACRCRTVDQSGRIIVPVYEENRLIKQMVIQGIERDLAIGTPVDVEFRIDVKHNIQVQVQVRDGGTGTGPVATASIEAPPPARRPTRAEIDEVQGEIEALVRDFSGSYRTRVTAQTRRLVQELHESLAYEDEPKAIQRMAELHDVLHQLQLHQGQILDPPWPRFAALVKQCLHLAATVADQTGRNRTELFEQVYTQERYAEQAYEEKNQTLYRECYDNLNKLAGYLDQLLHDALPRHRHGPAPSPCEEARQASERCRDYLAAVLDRVRQQGRADLQERLARLAGQGYTLPERVQADPLGAIREARRLMTEIAKIEQALAGPRRDESTAGPRRDESTAGPGLLESML
jgi:molecular chaperone DnaK